jgi:hypothetical protein
MILISMADGSTVVSHHDYELHIKMSLQTLCAQHTVQHALPLNPDSTYQPVYCASGPRTPAAAKQVLRRTLLLVPLGGSVFGMPLAHQLALAGMQHSHVACDCCREVVWTSPAV